MTTSQTSIDADHIRNLMAPPKPDPTDPDTWIIEPMEDMQQDAAVAPEGPLVIMGGSGTGKSRTLRNRALHLVKAGADPSTIAMLTFNARAGLRIRQDMSYAIGTDPLEVGFFIGTMHKYCSTMLRQAGWQYAGLNPSFSICDQEQSIILINEIANADNQEGPPVLKHLEVLNILQWISYNESVGEENRRPAREASWLHISEEYALEKRRQNLVDFTDLLVYTRDVLAHSKQLREAYNTIRTRNLLVDEFQDLTPLQYHIIKLMVGPTKSIAIALDPNQSIYQWRGASADLMQQFLFDYPDAQRKGLTINHRTCAAVMRSWRHMARSESMTGLIDDYQMSLRPGGEKPQEVCVPNTANSQYLRIAQHIDSIIKRGHYNADQVAILARRKSTIDRLVQHIDRMDIPHNILGSEPDEKDPNQQCITAMLTLATNPNNSWALRKGADCNVINKRRNLNNVIARDIQRAAKEQSVDLIEACRIILPKIHEDTSIHQQLSYTINTYQTITDMMEDPATTTRDLIQKIHDEMFRYATGRAQRQIAPPITKMFTIAERSDRASSPNISPRQRLSLFLEPSPTPPTPTRNQKRTRTPTSTAEASPWPPCTPAKACSGPWSSSPTAPRKSSPATTSGRIASA